jgi:hypothetical protein
MVEKSAWPLSEAKPLTGITRDNMYAAHNIVKILEAAPKIKRWLDDYKQEIVSLMEDEVVSIPNWELRNYTRHEPVTGDLAVKIAKMGLVARGRPLTASDIRQCAKYTLTQVTDFIMSTTTTHDGEKGRTHELVRKKLSVLFPKKTLTSLSKVR